MIVSFADKETQKLYRDGFSKKLPGDIQKAAIRKLDYLDAAVDIQDLRVPPGNRLEALSGNLAGKYSTRINDQYRIVFRFENGNSYEVEVMDYH